MTERPNTRYHPGPGGYPPAPGVTPRPPAPARSTSERVPDILDKLCDKAVTVQVTGGEVNLRVPYPKDLQNFLAHWRAGRPEDDKGDWILDLAAMALEVTVADLEPRSRDEWRRVIYATSTTDGSVVGALAGAAMKLCGLDIEKSEQAARLVRDHVDEADEAIGDVPT